MSRAALALIALVSAPVVAQPGAPPTNLALDQPERRISGATAYVCGGVGELQADAMRQMATDYHLMLTFAAPDGAFLADVDVRITDRRGDPVLQINCDAPMLLVDLPRAGAYRVEARAGGASQSRTVSAGARGHTRQVMTLRAGTTPFAAVPAPTEVR